MGQKEGTDDLPIAYSGLKETKTPLFTFVLFFNSTG